MNNEPKTWKQDIITELKQYSTLKTVFILGVLVMMILMVILVWQMSVQMPYGWKNQNPEIVVTNTNDLSATNYVYYWTGFNLAGVIACGFFIALIWFLIMGYGVWYLLLFNNTQGMFNSMLLFYIFFAIVYVVLPCLFNNALYDHWSNDWVHTNNDVLNGSYSTMLNPKGTIADGVICGFATIACLMWPFMIDQRLLSAKKSEEEKLVEKIIINTNYTKAQNLNNNSNNLTADLDVIYHEDTTYCARPDYYVRSYDTDNPSTYPVTLSLQKE